MRGSDLNQWTQCGRFLKLRIGETVADYILRQVDEGRIFIGVEGNELMISDALRVLGNKPFVFSSNYPHEVDAESCKAELEELSENKLLSPADKEAILFRNSTRFYRFTGD